MRNITQLYINRYDVLLITLLLYSISTLTQNIFPFKINRLLVGFIVCFYVVSVKKRCKYSLFLFLYFIFTFVDNILFTQNICRSFFDYTFFFLAILQLSFFSNKCNIIGFFKSNKRFDWFIGIVAYIDFFIIIISVVSPCCYEFQWAGSYLIGFTSSEHTMASGICLAMSILLIYQKKQKMIAFFMMTTYVFAVQKTGARIFLIPSILIYYFYLKTCIKGHNIRLLIYLFFITCFIIFFLNSEMYQKFLFTYQLSEINNVSLLNAITSSRSVFWCIDVENFLNSDIYEQLLGHGFDYIYRLNFMEIGMYIWAHNDYINILVSLGIVGLFIYLFYLIRFYKFILQSNSFFICLIIVAYYLLPSFFNGGYTYFHFISSFILFAYNAFFSVHRNFRI